ncbi:proclotting enzyme-like isoform X3 [Choristoneura fumiferana]|uniref:proclotting enzyme-like isoform X3 n=1 Tax=Choristoneura fumiferana TaxID=7141 RepID=UPI003D1591F2
MIRLLVLATLLALSLQQQAPLSPCPNVFSYEKPGSEPGRWYGEVNLSTDSILHSVWINIVLDSKADIVGNWVGDVTTSDNIDFKIENTKMKIHPGPATAVRFFVQYNPLNKAPKLQAIRLNGREICNANNPLPAVERPDDDRRTTSRPRPDLRPEDVPVSRPVQGQPAGIGPVYSSTERPIQHYPVNLNMHDDYFGGGRPTINLPNNPSNNNNNNYGNNNNAQAQCGKVIRNNPNPLVVNGRPTLEGQWPWQIALYHTQTVDNKYICGGTLVSRRHVITAAHCVTRKGSSRIVNPNTLTVFLGKHNLRTSVEGVQIKLVSDIRVHPSYNASSYSRDVSVLKLREQVRYTDFVRPACLWPDNEIDLSNVIGKKGSVVGWGFDDKGLATEELTLVEMPVVDQETCIRSYSEFFARFTSEYTYCAGYKDGTIDERTGTRKSSSVCNGDSGGGMVFLMRNSWFLRGLVSLSVARQNEYRCDPTHYVVFTDLAKFLPWIRQNIADE